MFHSTPFFTAPLPLQELLPILQSFRYSPHMAHFGEVLSLVKKGEWEETMRHPPKSAMEKGALKQKCI